MPAPRSIKPATARKAPDKRATARVVNKPVAARQPNTGVNKAKDAKAASGTRGRAPTKKTRGSK